MWSTSDMPPLATVARGRIAPNIADAKAWLVEQRPWSALLWGLRIFLLGAFVVRPIRIVRQLFGRKKTTRSVLRDFLLNGYPVAIWTPPGEWRVARTLQDLQQIIADGGEVDPPKDED